MGPFGSQGDGAATGHETPPPTVLFLWGHFGRLTAAGLVAAKH